MSRPPGSQTSSKRLLPLLVVAAVVVAIVLAILFRNSLGTGTRLSGAPASPADADTTAQPSPSLSPADAIPTKSPRVPVGSNLQGLPVQERMARVQQRRQEMRERTQKINEAGRQQRLAKFDSEQKDVGWASATERSLSNVISSERLAEYGVKSADTKVECRTSTCKITSVLADASQADDWTTLYMTNVGTSLPNAYVSRTTLPDGRVSVEVIGIGGGRK